MAMVQALHVYPVKSCRGIDLQAAHVTPQGIPYDRRWMVIDANTGKAMTQRTHPKMALIQVALPPEVFEAPPGTPPPPGAALTLSAAGVPGEVRVPLAIEGSPQLRKSNVWEWTGTAADEGEAAAEWLTAFLGRPVRLVRYLGTLDAAAADAAAALAAEALVDGGGAAGAEGAKQALSRAVDPEFVPWGSEVAFADGFPVLVAAAESMQDLNARLDPASPPADISRFRANIVLAGAGAWADDAAASLRLGSGGGGVAAPAGGGGGGAGGPEGGGGGAGGGGVEVALVKPCSRCTVPLVDQATGVVSRNKEPLTALQKFRTGSALGWERFGRSSTFFGTNSQPLGSGLVRVGDPATVLKTHSWAAAA